jgi:Ni,Fe-hydrogenase I large subunit
VTPNYHRLSSAALAPEAVIGQLWRIQDLCDQVVDKDRNIATLKERVATLEQGALSAAEAKALQTERDFWKEKCEFWKKNASLSKEESKQITSRVKKDLQTKVDILNKAIVGAYEILNQAIDRARKEDGAGIAKTTKKPRKRHFDFDSDRTFAEGDHCMSRASREALDTDQQYVLIARMPYHKVFDWLKNHPNLTPKQFQTFKQHLWYHEHASTSHPGEERYAWFFWNTRRTTAKSVVETKEGVFVSVLTEAYSKIEPEEMKAKWAW